MTEFQSKFQASKTIQHLAIKFEVIKSIPFNYKKLTLVIYPVLLSAICIFLNGFPPTKIQAQQPPDSVYRPLMKTWVKKDPPVVKNEAPLNHICATDDKKNNFFNALEESLRLSPLSKITDSESLFFSYMKVGKDAFRTLTEPINIPNQQTFVANKNYTTNGSSKTNLFLKQTGEIVSLQTRPPTFFNRQIVRKLKDISDNISPRAPPVLV